MDYLKIAKETCSNIDSPRVMGVVEELLDQEQSVNRDMALMLIGKDWAKYMATILTGEKAHVFFNLPVWGRLWDTLETPLEKICDRPPDIRDKLVQDWWDGNEITLD